MSCRSGCYLAAVKRRLLLFLLLAFVLLNAVAFFHAWRFTHFSAEAGPHSASPEQLTLAQKLGLLLTGVRNPKPVNGPAPDFPVQTVHFTSPNGRLEAWYARPTGPPQGAVALFHGYGSSKSQLGYVAGYFRQLGYVVLMVDLAGNGNSAGRHTTVGYREAEDVAAAVRWLQDSAKHQTLILYGISMGAVAILRAEAKLGIRPTANVLECPYGSMRQTAYNRFRSMHVPPFPLADLLVFWGGVQNGFWAFGLRGEDYARRVQVPTLLLWGTADPRVSRAETDAIFKNLAGPKARVNFGGCGHEPYWGRYPAAWRGQVGRFLLATVPPR